MRVMPREIPVVMPAASGPSVDETPARGFDNFLQPPMANAAQPTPLGDTPEKLSVLPTEGDVSSLPHFQPDVAGPSDDVPLVSGQKIQPADEGGPGRHEEIARYAPDADGVAVGALHATASPTPMREIPEDDETQGPRPISGTVQAADLPRAPVERMSHVTGRQQRDMVFEFDDLGMFGRYGSHFHKASVALGEREETGEVSGASVQSTVAMPQWALHRSEDSMASPGRSPLASPASDVLHPGLALSEGPGTVARSLLGGGGTKASPTLPAVIPEDESGPAGSALPAARMRSGESESALRLLVAGGDNALSVLARSVDGSLDGAALRRAIADTAAEFGLTVSDIRINGKTQEAIMGLGGSSGSRTR